MSGSECAPVTVEGSWDPGQSRTVRNKLLLYFQTRRRSGGGDCRVEAEEGAPRAAVFFQDDDVRERVLARKNHEIILEDKTIKLRLCSAPSQTSSTPQQDSLKSPRQSGNGPQSATHNHPSIHLLPVNPFRVAGLLEPIPAPLGERLGTPWTDRQSTAAAAHNQDSLKSPRQSGNGAQSATHNQDSSSSQISAVLLDNISPSLSSDLLSMLVENVSGLDESGYNLEVVWETNKAVVTFNDPAGSKKHRRSHAET
ncbi:protein mono-ADP-ribosyltransferase PARP14-like [Pholidichthys leucotaenia]